MINMRRFFLLFLFISTTNFVDSLVCIADGGFYEQIRKKKNLGRGEIEAIRKETLDEERRSRVNQISSESKAQTDENPKVSASESEESDEHAETSKPVIKTQSSRPENHSVDVKVNPGSIDELEFPGE